MLEVKAILEEVVNGEVKQLRIGDDVYAVQFIGCYIDVEEAVENEIIEKVKEDKDVEKPVIKKKKSHKRRRKRPSDAIGFDKKYKAWILSDDFQKVKNAVNKFGVLSTSKYIQQETELSLHKVMATLDYMISHGKIQRKTSNQGKLYYSFVE